MYKEKIENTHKEAISSSIASQLSQMQLSNGNHFLYLHNSPIICRQHHKLIRNHNPIVLSVANSPKLVLSESLQQETLRSLEWPTLCHQLSSFTQTSMGHAVVQKAQIPVGKSLEESQKLLNQTSAALAMMQSQPLDLSTIEDITGILNSALSGRLLSLSEICAVRRTLRAVNSVWEKLTEAAALDGDSLQRYYF